VTVAGEEITYALRAACVHMEGEIAGAAGAAANARRRASAARTGALRRGLFAGAAPAVVEQVAARAARDAAAAERRQEELRHEAAQLLPDLGKLAGGLPALMEKVCYSYKGESHK
jgi:hypothetical protein